LKSYREISELVLRDKPTKFYDENIFKKKTKHVFLVKFTFSSAAFDD